MNTSLRRTSSYTNRPAALLAAALAGTLGAAAQAEVHFKDNASGRFTITGWTDPAGNSGSSRPGQIGMTSSLPGNSLGGPGQVTGTGTSKATSGNGMIHPGGLVWGDAGTGVSANANAEGKCSPAGFAFNSNLGTSFIKLENTGTGTCTMHWVLDFEWLSETIGTLPLLESGLSRGEVTVHLDGNELVKEGTPVQYLPGGSLTDSGSKTGSVQIKSGEVLTLYVRAYAGGAVNAYAAPAPGSLVLGAVGMALFAGTRRRARAS